MNREIFYVENEEKKGKATIACSIAHATCGVELVALIGHDDMTDEERQAMDHPVASVFRKMIKEEEPEVETEEGDEEGVEGGGEGEGEDSAPSEEGGGDD